MKIYNLEVRRTTDGNIEIIQRYDGESVIVISKHQIDAAITMLESMKDAADE